jgi:hexosaminidase
MNVNYCRPSDKIEIMPTIDPSRKTAVIKLNTEQHKPEIRYTTDGSLPSETSKIYRGEFDIAGSSMVKASVMRNGRSTRVDTLLLDFHTEMGKKVIYNKPWNNSYPAQRESTLVNGYKGTLTYQDGQWQGFTTDMDVVIDLGETQPLNHQHFYAVIGPGFTCRTCRKSVSNDGNNLFQAGKPSTIYRR